MLEYFAYKKFKKNKAEKEAAAATAASGAPEENATSTPSASASASSDKGKRPLSGSGSGSGSRTPSTALATPLLNDDDERFLERLTSPTTSTRHGDDDEADEEGPRPPLPPRVKTPDLTWDSDSESFRKSDAVVDDDNKQSTSTSAKDKGKAALNRVSVFLKSKTGTINNRKKSDNQLAVPSSSSSTGGRGEVTREEDDLTRVLEDLNLAAKNNKAFALSADSNELVRKFTLVLKDLVNGVPTAVNDLTSLLDDRDGILSKNYEKLPSSLKKLVTQLPDKLSDSLAPELLAVAAGAQGISAEEAAKKGGIKGAAKRMLIPKNLKDLVTKPGAVVSMLKGIMNALKVRWPAFMGTNVIWSLALFLLLFVLWYCHKRGREVRLEGEKAAAGVVDGSGRIEELPDDPALPAPSRRAEGPTSVPVVVEPASDGDGEDTSRRRRSSRRRSRD